MFVSLLSHINHIHRTSILGIRIHLPNSMSMNAYHPNVSAVSVTLVKRFITTVNNRLLNVRSGHPQQEHANQHSSTLATSTLANEYDDDPTTATTNSNNNKPRRRRRIQRYTLGEVARTPRDMVILRSNDKAIESASTLKKYDQAFLKRSNGLW